jgi:hypothetical protein
VVTCPQCNAIVAPNWDWCQRCGFDPDGLRPPSAPAVAPPAGPVSTPATPRDDRSGGLTPSELAQLKRPSGAPGADEPQSAPSVVDRQGPTAGTVGDASSSTGAARPHRWRRWVLVVAVVAAAGVAATVVVARRGSSADARSQQLGAKVLSVDDLPSGWSGVPPFNPLAGSGHGCLLAEIADARDTSTKVAAGLRAANGVPNLVERVEESSVPQATARFDALLALALHGCPPIAGPSARGGSTPTPVTVLARPRIGDASAAFEIPTRNGTVALFLGRAGARVVTMGVVTKGPVDLAFFDQAVSTSMNKLLR